LLVFNEVKYPSTKEPIATIAKNNAVAKKVSEEIKVYTEGDHLKSVGNKPKGLYSELKSAILNLGKDIEVRPKKYYIVFRRKQNFVAVDFIRSNLKVWLNIGIKQITDPLKIAKIVNDPRSGGKHTIITVQDIGEIPYAMSLIKQAYEKS